MACFRANFCCYPSENYSLEEEEEICNELASASKATFDATRANFEQKYEAAYLLRNA